MEATGFGTGDLRAIEGTAIPVVAGIGPDGYVTLVADDWYFIVGGSRDATVESIQIVTDATIAGTFTLEVCNLPRDAMNGPALVPDNSEVVGEWVQWNPTGGYVASSGTGWVWTLYSGVKTAGVGGAMIIFVGNGARRVRLKFTCTTGGKVRVNAAAKTR